MSDALFNGIQTDSIQQIALVCPVLWRTAQRESLRAAAQPQPVHLTSAPPVRCTGHFNAQDLEPTDLDLQSIEQTTCNIVENILDYEIERKTWALGPAYLVWADYGRLGSLFPGSHI